MNRSQTGLTPSDIGVGPESEPETLLDHVRNVAHMRSRIASLRAIRDKRLQEWEEANAELLADLRDASDILAACEDELRAAAIMAYQTTGSKQPAPGVGIRILRKPVYDVVVARRWCEEHQMFMAVEWRLFDKFVKDNLASVRFVTVLEEAQATIATDLAKAVGLQEVEA